MYVSWDAHCARRFLSFTMKYQWTELHTIDAFSPTVLILRSSALGEVQNLSEHHRKAILLLWGDAHRITQPRINHKTFRKFSKKVNQLINNKAYSRYRDYPPDVRCIDFSAYNKLSQKVKWEIVDTEKTQETH